MTTAEPRSVRRPAGAPSGERGLLRMLATHLAPHRGVLVASMALAVVGQGLLALVPLLQKVIVDDAIVTDERPIGGLVLVLLLIGVVGFVAHAGRRYLGARLALDVQHDLRVAIHRHVHVLDAGAHDRLAAGDVLSRATSDLTLVQLFLAQVPLMVANLTLLTVALVVMLALSPLLFVGVLGCVPVLGVLGIRFRAKAFPASWYDQRLAGALAGAAEETVLGVRVVKAFGQEDRETDAFVHRAGALYASRVRTARLTTNFGATLQAVPAAGQFGALALGGWLAYRGDLSIGTFLAFASYLVQLVTPLRLLAGMIGAAQQARAGMQRVDELLDVQPGITDRPGAVALPAPAGAVRLDGVGVAYDGGAPVLTDVHLEVPPGRRVALVGSSGSGKTTLALLLGRAYDPDAGVVSIGGTDLRDATLASVRAAVAYVFEDSFLFTGTVRDNIAFARPDATDAEVEAVARVARAHEFVVAMPEGYATRVGDRGATLSGGQRQRIALARALLSDAPVLVLDDATSSIDVRTEEAIFTDPALLASQRTIVLVARRPSTVRLADHVVVLDHGRVVATGTDDELRRSSSLYRALLVGTEVADDGPPDAVVVVTDPEAWPATPDGSADPFVADVTGHAGPGLLRRVAALPPADERPDVDVAALRDPVEPFSFRSLLRPFRTPLLVVAALMVVDAATTLVGPLLFRYGIDEGVQAHRAGALVLACVVFLVVQVVSWANARSLQLAAARSAERVLFSIRVRLFAHLQRLSLDHYERSRAGGILTRLTSDVDALAQLVQQGLVTALVSLLSCVGVIAVLVGLDVRLAGVVLTVMPFLALGGWAFVRGSTSAYLSARALLGEVNADLQEHLAGMRVTQSHGRQAALQERFEHRSRRYRDARRRSSLMIAVFFPYLALLSNVAKALTLLVAARWIDGGTLSTGVLIAFLLYADQFFSPLQQLSMALDGWIQARVSFARIAELLHTTPTVLDPHVARTLPALRGTIDFEGVRFAYGPTTPEVLHGIDLHIGAGEVVALVGTTGAGKSTFVKLVDRFYDPTAGHVLVDGVPLTELALGPFRRQVGYVPQDPHLFTGTVASNIAYGRPDATDLAIERAARAVGAHAFVRSLPAGYRTPVRSGTQSLSAGERQLLCLARAELIDPVLLVLDEATSNVDVATEEHVQRAMGLLARGRTTLLIAHRLRSAASAGRVVVIEDGRVVQDGTHDALLAAEGPYAAMWSTFARAQRDDVAPFER